MILWELVELIDEHVELPSVAVPNIPVDRVGSNGQIEDAAALVRENWRLPPGPIGNIVRTMESNGIAVAELNLGSRDVDAFSFDAGGRPLVLLVTDKGDAARTRFDSAHELGHLVMHRQADSVVPILERQANAFAAAFLAPAEQIWPELPGGWDLDHFVALKHRWGLSVAALLFRARELGAMDGACYRNAVAWMASHGYRSHEPEPLIYSDRPHLLGEAVELLTQAGIGRGELADRLGVSVGRLNGLIADSPTVDGETARPRTSVCAISTP